MKQFVLLTVVTAVAVAIPLPADLSDDAALIQSTAIADSSLDSRSAVVDGSSHDRRSVTVHQSNNPFTNNQQSSRNIIQGRWGQKTPYEILQAKKAQKSAYYPHRMSFQAASYVQDDLPAHIFFLENRDKIPDPRAETIRQTATVTHRPNLAANAYVDEYNPYEGLTKAEERVKIFYGGNLDMIPRFKNMKKEEDSRKKLNRLFNYYQTQRAGAVLPKERNPIDI